MRTLTPGTSRSSRWMRSRSRRWASFVPDANIAAEPYFSGSSDTSQMVSTPSPRTWWLIAGGSSGPSWGCPPVIATASLKRTL